VAGVESLYAKMRAAGLPIEELPGPPPLPADLGPEEQAARAIRMQQANMLGEKKGPPSRDPVRRSLDLDAAPHDGCTIEWDFTDADPWHIVVANGDTRVVSGHAADPEVRLRTGFEDFVDVTAGRLDPLRAMATGRMRPRGSPLAIWRIRKLFPSR
jgi:hypothetical protein